MTYSNNYLIISIISWVSFEALWSIAWLVDVDSESQALCSSLYKVKYIHYGSILVHYQGLSKFQPCSTRQNQSQKNKW
jgi:hypothetical protein